MCLVSSQQGHAGVDALDLCHFRGRFDGLVDCACVSVGLCDVSGVFIAARYRFDDPEPILQERFCLSSEEETVSITLPQRPWSGFEFVRHHSREIAFCEEGSCEILQCQLPSDSPKIVNKIYKHESREMQDALSSLQYGQAVFRGLWST